MDKDRTGLFKMSDEDYFALDAVNASKLKAFRKAPVLAISDREETAAMRMGNLVHCAMLEPEQLEARYKITDLDRRGTKAWAAEEQAAEGRELTKRNDYETAIRMRDSVWGNPYARGCLEGSVPELVSVWEDEETGLLCKAKADLVNLKNGCLVDVKTTSDASPREFTASFAKYSYWLQESFYRSGFAINGFGSIDAMNPTPFLFIAVEKSAPYLVSVYELSDTEHERVSLEIRRLLLEYKNCINNGSFPGYPYYNRIKLPGWALKEQ